MSITVGMEMMLFEAGIIANGLHNGPKGQDLFTKLMDQSDAAEAEGKPNLTFQFTAFEAGMAYGSIVKLTGAEADDMANRMLQAVREVMQEIGAIPPGSVSEDETKAEEPAPAEEAAAPEAATEDDSSGQAPAEDAQPTED